MPLEAADALLPWSRWVTPAMVPIRFDTRFYVALAAAPLQAEPDSVEIDDARWIAPAMRSPNTAGTSSSSRSRRSSTSRS